MAALPWLFGAIVLLASCGARTGLQNDTPVALDSGFADATNGEPEAPDIGAPDAEDGPDDATSPAPEKSLPVINPGPPPPVASTSCSGMPNPVIYVVTQDTSQLLAFDPSTAAFRVIGTLLCPSEGMPVSMAVDRSGTAYVLFTDGHLFRVSTQTAQCDATAFMGAQEGFSKFGMAFSASPSGTFEMLYVVGNGELATIDLTTYKLHLVGPGAPSLAELTGTSDGRLFAFSASSDGSAISQLDPARGNVVALTDVPKLQLGDGWAFAFWAGDFYLFTQSATSTGSQVTRFRPSDQSQLVVATLSSSIVGAGLSTCAPPM